MYGNGLYTVYIILYNIRWYYHRGKFNLGLMAGRLIDAGHSWVTVYYLCGSIVSVVFLLYFIFGDDAPEGTRLTIFDKIRPWRFSAIMTNVEKEEIISARMTKKRMGKLEELEYEILSDFFKALYRKYINSNARFLG